MVKRVYEFAKELNCSSKEILERLRAQGYDIKNHMAVMTDEMIASYRASNTPAPSVSSSKNASAGSSTQSTPASAHKKTIPSHSADLEHQMSQSETSVTTSRAVPSSASGAEQKKTHHPKNRDHSASQASRSNDRSHARRDVATAKQSDVASGPDARRAPLVVERMTVGDFVERSGIAMSDVIGTLLRRGVMAPKSFMLTKELVEALVRNYNIPFEEPVAVKPSDVREEAIRSSVSEGVVITRMPVIVVMGHVDHGKTTLLDTIRKTRVAAREKGGITQHLGAYEVKTAHGSLVFLDTPGHEAFSMIRTRGARVADIAILVIAADDGMKPQTLEALRVIQAAQIPMIVALNKIDKVAPAQLDVVRRELSQHGLVAEEWGGTTTVVPISAKQGKGIDELLEILALQSHMLDLAVRTDVPARGAIIESRMERGLGSVGTLILREGTLHVGDHFVSGATSGRVSILTDACGRRVREVGPATPVTVVGFEDMPQAGDEFLAVPDLASRKAHQEQQHALKDKFRTVRTGDVQAGASLGLIVKADTISTLEAITGSIERFIAQKHAPLYIIHGGIGAISESDVDLALTTNAQIFGLHVKTEPNAALLAQREHVSIHLHDIIYAMLDDIIARIPKEKTTTKVTKKVGEAVVLKIFEIKKMGIIAGAQVKSGIFTRDGLVKVYRGKNLVGEGTIKGLQRDRKAVKEVHSGFECAFLVDGFEAWEEGDRVECYSVQ